MTDETPGDPPSPGDSSSPLDDLFVEGARYHEPSAAERERQAKEFQRRGKEAAKANKKARRREGRRAPGTDPTDPLAAPTSSGRRFLPWIIFAVLVAIAWYIVGGGGDSDTDDAENTTGDTTAQISPADDPRPTTARLMYATTADSPAEAALPDAIRHEIAITNDWLADETGGRRINFAETGGELDLEATELTLTSEDLATRSDAYVFVAEDLGFPTDEFLDEIVVVFVPVTFESQERCGEGSQTGLVVVWIGTCDLQPAADSVWPTTASVTVAHELMHALGAVDSCAPHYGRNGHVVDDPDDLMFDGERTAEAEFALDPGRDDYYDHDLVDCVDVADHPAWVDAGA